MGAALTYARRYALFALVGIAGEDDLDAPDLLTEPSPAVTTDTSQGAPNGRKSPNGSIHKPRQPKPLLAIEPSAALRSELIAEIQQFKDPDDLALWAHRRLPAKNTLTADDARAVEAAYQELLIQSDAQPQDVAALDQPTSTLASPLLEGRSQAQQGPSRVCGSASLPDLQTLALRCPSSQICPAAIARAQGQ